MEDQRYHIDTAEYGLSSRLVYLVIHYSICYYITECVMSFYTEIKKKRTKNNLSLIFMIGHVQQDFIYFLFISSHRVDGPFSTADFQRGPQT